MFSPMKYLPVLIAILTFPSIALGQGWAQRLFEETFHNFGDVPQRAKAEHVFTFVNNLDTTIRISNVRASCGCTTPVIETPVVRPGEEGRIRAVYNTGSFFGRKGATITVTFSQPSWTEAQLRVDGFIRTDLLVEPGAVDFREVNSPEPVTRRLAVQFSGSDRWAIQDVVSSNPDVKTEWEEVRRGNGRVAYDLLVTLDPQRPGYINDQLVIRTNDRMYRDVPLVVSGYVRPMLEVPSVVDFGTIRAGEPVTRPLVIRAGREFTVLDVRASDSRLSLSKSDDPKRMHMLEMQMTADEEGLIDEVIEIETDVPGAETTRVRVTGRVVQP